MKLFGLSATPGTVIYYGNNLRLYLDSSVATYGLSLIYFDGTVNNYMGTFSTFNTYMGKWAYISISIYYDSSLVTKTPYMLNFQVDVNNVTITPSLLPLIANFSFLNFKIPPPYCKKKKSNFMDNFN